MAIPGKRLSDLIDELGAVLAEERQALLSGSPERIATMTQKKMLIADMIEEATVAAGTPRPSLVLLAPLARYNQENAIICGAMLRHLTEAIDRLRQVDLHRSYNPDGSEQSCSAQHPLGAA
ncbi:MAG TPA: hypothetical protein VET89_11860 [Stellaceae bacterium]|jgi:flagellar biosynthesis/type III secretory pathway chaperone|nr:hypothetical protein [Stellaceae bacterium]